MTHSRTLALLCLALVAACDSPDPATAPPRGITPHALVATAVMVTNTNDAGPGSLRDAIATAASGSTIQFDASVAGQTIALTTGDLEISQADLTIEGPGTGVTISGNDLSRVLTILGAKATVRNLTITGGRASNGAGVFTAGATDVVLDHVLVVGNQISVVGDGAGIEAAGRLSLINSTVSGNSGAFRGGGISATGELFVTNTTVANNRSTQGGGGIAFRGPLTLRNSIVSGNLASVEHPNCLREPGGFVTGLGTNIVSDDDCGTTNVLIADPMLGPLANNGGPTQTVALTLGSPAIDAATDCNVTDDQRHVTRPRGPACDVGAFEFTDYVTPALTIDASAVGLPGNSAAVVSGSVTCSKPGTIALEVKLSQPQKIGRVNAIVDATGVVSVDCGAKKYWSVALKPASGGFQNGAATATVATTAIPSGFLPKSVSAPVKVFWAKK